MVAVLNATPDSFSDSHPDTAEAVDHGLALLAAGADVIDVGGESTRPGADRVDEAVELARVLPVVTALAGAGALVSIDTTRSLVAERALHAGARIVNDVSGGLADPEMLPLLARSACRCVLMHWRGLSKDMQTRTQYDDVVADVRAALLARRRAAEQAGVDPALIVLDPGLGFGKTAAQSWQLLAALDQMPSPLLVGASRKGFLGTALGDGPRATGEREDATTAVTVLAAQAGAWGVRVHEPRASVDAVHVVDAVRTARDDADRPRGERKKAERRDDIVREGAP